MQREVIVEVVVWGWMQPREAGAGTGGEGKGCRSSGLAQEEVRSSRRQGSTSAKCHVAALEGAGTVKDGVVRGVKGSTAAGRKEPRESHQTVVTARPEVASEKVGATEP